MNFFLKSALLFFVKVLMYMHSKFCKDKGVLIHEDAFFLFSANYTVRNFGYFSG